MSFLSLSFSFLFREWGQLEQEKNSRGGGGA